MFLFLVEEWGKALLQTLTKKLLMLNKTTGISIKYKLCVHNKQCYGSFYRNSSIENEKPFPRDSFVLK